MMVVFWGWLLIDVCRTGIASGSPVPIEMMKRLIEQLNLRELTVAFGMSASSSFTIAESVTDP